MRKDPLADYRTMKHPALIYVLRGLLPPNRENLLLSFKPGKFFYELSKVSGYKEQYVKTAYYRARKQGLIDDSTVPQVTEKGLRKVRPYVAKTLGKDAHMLLIYDIPQYMESERRALKRLLHNLDFELVQQSVWSTNKDHRETIREAVKKLDIAGYVQIYESIRLKI